MSSTLARRLHRVLSGLGKGFKRRTRASAHQTCINVAELTVSFKCALHVDTVRVYEDKTGLLLKLYCGSSGLEHRPTPAYVLAWRANFIAEYPELAASYILRSASGEAQYSQGPRQKAVTMLACKSLNAYSFVASPFRHLCRQAS